MVLLTRTYLVKGKNRKYLLERLQKKGVNLLKIENCGQNEIKITIENKDRLKFFAICKNSWYNKELKIGGLLSPFYKCYQKWLLTLFLVSYFALSFIASNLYFETVFTGDALIYRPIIEKALESQGIIKYSFFSQKQLNGVKESLQKEMGIAFISVEKSGNRAIIYLKEEKKEPSSLNSLTSDLIANEDMTVLNITLYSGTAVVSNGDFIKKGELIAKAKNLLNDADKTEIDAPIIGVITVECTFEYCYNTKFKPTDDTRSNALAMAKFHLGDYIVRSFSFEEGENFIKVILKYEKILIGG